jgi:hypothetical protein
MSELKKATSTWASTRSRHAVVRMESTAPFTFSTPESACTKGRPAVTRCLPGGNGGTGDLHVLGNGPGAATNAMFAKAMVVGAPSLRLGRDSGNHPRRLPCTSENRNDIEGAATANTKLRMSSFAAVSETEGLRNVRGQQRVRQQLWLPRRAGGNDLPQDQGTWRALHAGLAGMHFLPHLVWQRRQVHGFGREGEPGLRIRQQRIHPVRCRALLRRRHRFAAGNLPASQALRLTLHQRHPMRRQLWLLRPNQQAVRVLRVSRAPRRHRVLCTFTAGWLPIARRRGSPDDSET